MIDRFEYAGKPLVYICTTGGNCGAEPMPTKLSPASGWRYFRLQVDDSHAGFFLSPDGRTWSVQFRDGTTSEFGVPVTFSSIGATDPPVDTDGNPSHVHRWNLASQIDGNGNVIAYGWKNIQPGLTYLTDIWDTPAFGQVQDASSYANHAQLTWDQPDYELHIYATTRADRIQRAYFLSGVTLSSIPWGGGATRTVVRSYQLGYYAARTTINNPGTGTSPLWHHAFLSQLTTCDGGGAEPAPGVNPDCSSAPPPIKLSYANALGVGSHGATFATLSLANSAYTYNGPRAFEGLDGSPLPYGLAVGIIDVNKDGLPDVVTGMNTQFARNRKGNVWLSNTASFPGSFTHSCADMQSLLDVTVTSERFLRSGVSLFGSWGTGNLIWADKGTVGVIGIDPDPSDPNSSDFCDETGEQLWKWSTGHAYGWMSDGGPAQDPAYLPSWYTDVDGDGLLDEIASGAHPSPGQLTAGRVYFTRRYGAGEFHQDGGTNSVAMMRAFDPVIGPGNATSSHETLVPGTSPAAGDVYSYADVTGDGLVDLIYFKTGAPAAAPVVRPGDGMGGFGCDPSAAACTADAADAPYETSTGYPLQLGSPSPMVDLVNPPSYTWYFHDVTGDGLADLVGFQPFNDNIKSSEADHYRGLALLWVNIDGRSFQCVNASPPAHLPPCVAGVFYYDQVLTDTGDDSALQLEATYAMSAPIFADMDSNGTDELVWVRYDGIFTLPFLDTSPSGAQNGRSPKPGLLTQIDNGRGVTTSINYETLYEHEHDSVSTWSTHAPVTGPIVTTISSQSTNPDATSFDLAVWMRTNFTYADPAYDSWTGNLAGFSRISRSHDFDVETTTYWFSSCQQTLQNGGACPYGSDDFPLKALSGRKIRVDHYCPVEYQFPSAA